MKKKRETGEKFAHVGTMKHLAHHHHRDWKDNVWCCAADGPEPHHEGMTISFDEYKPPSEDRIADAVGNGDFWRLRASEWEKP